MAATTAHRNAAYAAFTDTLAREFDTVSESLHDDATQWDGWVPTIRARVLRTLIERGVPESEAEQVVRMLAISIENAAHHARTAAQEICDVALTVSHVIDTANRVPGRPPVTTLPTGV